MSVCIAFTASSFPIAKLIRWVTKGRTSHVMIVYDDMLWGGSWVSEATVGGVQNRPAKRSMHHVVAMFECKFNASPGLQEIKKYVGDQFDYSGLVFFGWAKLVWKLFRVKARRPWKTTRAQFCSEYVSRFLSLSEKLSVIPKLNGLYESPEKNYPEQLLKLLENNPTQFERVVP